MKSTKWNRVLSSLAGGMLAMAFALVPDVVFAAKTVSSDYTLSADEDWRADGVVTVEEGVNVDLNGHVLYLAGLAGKGSFTASENASFTDLTGSGSGSATLTVDGDEVESAGNGRYPASQAFDNDLETITYYRSFSTQFEFAINYDFGSSTYVNCYKLYVGARSDYPTAWTFQGLDSDSNWIDLDSRTGQTFSSSEWNSYTFFPTSGASYSKFRLKVTAVKGNNSHLSLTEMQIGILKSQIRIDPSQSAGFAAASNSVANSVDVVITGGTLDADIDLRGLSRKVTLGGDLDLNGYALKVAALDGSGEITSTVDVPDGTTALTTTDSSKLSSVVSVLTNGTASALNANNVFDNSTSTKVDFNLGAKVLFPVSFIYDFETPTAVNRYTVTIENDMFSAKRAPKDWILYGADDKDDPSTWKWLDGQTNDVSAGVLYAPVKDCTFSNYTPYRYYILSISDTGNSNARLDLNEIEYYYAGDGNYVEIENSGLADSDLSDITVSGNAEIVSSGDFTLTEDAIFTSLGAFHLSGIIDLAGHDLTVSTLSGSGTITDSSTGDPGTLTVDVDAGASQANTGVSLTGNLKLVKEGAGTLTMTKDSQTYTGGTQVVEGTLTCGANGTATPLASGDITVESGGIFEMNGKNGYSSQQVILNGGTLMNSVNIGADNGSGTLCKLKLTADSTWTCAGTHYFGLANDAEKNPTIDLNGHALDVTIARDRYLRIFSTTITNGTFSVSGSGTFISGGSGIEARTVDFKVNCPLFINQALSVRNYESLWTSDNYNRASNTNRLSVYGTFTPTTTYFYGCTLMDGATIDLSGLSDTLSITSDSQYGLTTLTFADDATVYVDVGTRSFISSPCLLSWTEDTQPSNLSSLSFKRPEGTERVYGIAKQDGGLYYTGAGLIILFR